MNKERFFAVVPALKVEDVKIPGTDETVKVRELSVRERIDLEALVKGKDGVDAVGRIIAATVVDEDGGPIFTAADWKRLEDLPVSVLDPLVEAAQRLNGFTAEAVEAEGKD